MDDLRWILLALAVVVVVAVYVWSRAKKQDTYSTANAVVEEIPSFNARTDDGWIDGVSPVRIVAEAEDIQVLDDVPVSLDGNSRDDVKHEKKSAQNKISTEKAAVVKQASVDIDEPVKKEEIDRAVPTQAAEQDDNDKTVAPSDDEISTDDVIALYLIVKDKDALKGESILSAALANQLQYGDMKIFHRKDSHQKTIFSMANMHEPGHFDSVTIHKLRTRGVSFFIQLSLCDDPVKALDDMLICAHSMAGMLGTHLCDQNRHLLNEVFTRALREKAKHFSA